jgi:hypothetical protein
MEIHKSCPECHAKILADSTSCRCGWHAEAVAKNQAVPTVCNCGARGVVSLTTSGSGEWYCREHWAKVNSIQHEGKGNQLAFRKPKSGAARWQPYGWDMRGKRYVFLEPPIVPLSENETGIVIRARMTDAA